MRGGAALRLSHLLDPARPGPRSRPPASLGRADRGRAERRQAAGTCTAGSPRPLGPLRAVPFRFRPLPSPLLRAGADSAPLARLPAGVTSPSPAPYYKYWRRPHRLPTLSGSSFRCRVSFSSAFSVFSHPFSLFSSVVWRRRVLSPPSPRPSSSTRAGVQFLSVGRRLHCCPAGVGAALFLLRRPRSLWPRPPWVFLLKVTTSLFKNSAEKEKTLYPTLWAVISRRTF